MAGRAPGFREAQRRRFRPSAGYRLTLPSSRGRSICCCTFARRHELDILNIPIAFRWREYCDYLDMMEDMAVEVAAEYCHGRRT